jgi:hypothetical protein
MCRSSSESERERDRQVQDVVLRQIVSLHPVLLTSDELVVWLEGSPADDIGRHEIVGAIGMLKRSGLLRQCGKTLEPTLPAHCALKVLRS